MKITKGYSPPIVDGPVLSRTQMQKALARQAALEKGLAKYIHISCGHYTDLETQERYGFARPKRGMVYCEDCDKWLKPVKPPVPPDLPNEPMF